MAGGVNKETFGNGGKFVTLIMVVSLLGKFVKIYQIIDFKFIPFTLSTVAS